MGFLNSFIHVVMYFYYFLTSVSDKYKGNVWWKKHITQLQIVSDLCRYLKPSNLTQIPLSADSIRANLPAVVRPGVPTQLCVPQVATVCAVAPELVHVHAFPRLLLPCLHQEAKASPAKTGDPKCRGERSSSQVKDQHPHRLIASFLDGGTFCTLPVHLPVVAKAD